MKRSQAGIVFTQWSKNRFCAPHGLPWLLYCPDKREIWHGEPHAKLHVYRGRNVGIFPQKFKISNFGHKFTPHGRLVCSIFTKFSAFVRVYRWLLSFKFGHFRGTNNQNITIFPWWGHFPSNFQSSLAAKLLIGSKKLGECNNGKDLLYHRAKYGGDRGFARRL